ncbi:hypothetical protein HUK80_00455 [Flavobacterium sp. MAH-1]|uniref:YD repeat-containing protein n=1 Tax=Flavobacterium agri TaxID=2743471 RepID=A0A7Y8XYN2_9FLAO|nr:hypothetical protein [Flavobacterium agri]NUY79348.1 hypothetical protein [Flavobacterium agri]NYA69372.1 hypothetical protein [Flavobacterium agri]
MKTTIFTIAAAFFAFAVQAQQVQKESTTTVTTVKDSDGEKKLVKTQTEQQVQKLEFQNPDSKALNKDLAPTPTQVTATTTVTAPDGTTRVVDVDRSAYYTWGGSKYQVKLDNVGYTLTNNGKRSAVLRNVGPNNYIYSTNGKTSYASFDSNGNMVLSTYDPKTDKVTTETYTRN